MRYCNLITIKQYLPIFSIFALLFIVFIISSAQSQKSLRTEISENKDLQIEGRQIQNDYRNSTISYLVNLTNNIDVLNNRMDSLEQKIINN